MFRKKKKEKKICTVHFSMTAFKHGPNSSAFAYIKKALNHKAISPEVKSYSSQGL